MTSSTHIIISTIAMCTVNAVAGESSHLAPIAVAAVASLLPDIDHPRSRIGRLCPPVSSFLYRKVGHRTLTHSIFGWLITAVIFLPLKYIDGGGSLYKAAIIGYVSHAIIDLVNKDGVCLTYPIGPHHRWVLPANAERRIEVDSGG